MMNAWWKLHHKPISLLAVTYAAATVPFISKYPYNWDAAQFNFGLHHYAIAMHQPHPPGYPLFILLGKLFALVFSDNVALVIVASLIGFISVLVLYQFAYRLWNQTWAAVTVAVLWMANPFFWLHREVALSYTTDAAASLALGYVVFQTVTTRQRHYLLWGATILTLAGAIRPSILVLLLPFFLYQCWYHRRNWKLLLLAATILIGGSALWFIPVVLLTGGLGEYLVQSKNLYGTAATSTSVLFGVNFDVAFSQIYLVMVTIITSLNVLLLPILLGAYLMIKRYRGLWLYGVLWVVPAWLFFCLVHFGQYAYALLIISPAYITLIPVLQWVTEHWSGWKLWLTRWYLVGAVALQCLAFFGLSATYMHPNFFPHNRAELWLQHLGRWAPNLFHWNNNDLVQSDEILQRIVAAVEQYPTDETLVITGRDILYPSPYNSLRIRTDELFREVGVLLPDYQVVEFAPKRDYYLQSYQYQTDTIFQRTLVVPNNVRYIIFTFDTIPGDIAPAGIITTAVDLDYQDRQLYLGLMQGPFQFVGFTVQREADTIGAE